MPDVPCERRLAWIALAVVLLSGPSSAALAFRCPTQSIESEISGNATVFVGNVMASHSSDATFRVTEVLSGRLRVGESLTVRFVGAGRIHVGDTWIVVTRPGRRVPWRAIRCTVSGPLTDERRRQVEDAIRRVGLRSE